MRATILATTLALILAGPAVGGHTTNACPADVSTIDAGDLAIYLVHGHDGEVWIYLESNGHEGLQRGDTSLPLFTDACQDFDPATGEFFEPDTAIF